MIPKALVTITLKNGSTKVLDASSTTVNLTYGPNGDVADSVYDDGIQDFTGNIPPAHAQTAKYGFAVPRARQVVTIEVEPGFGTYESVFFEATI